MPGLLDQPTYDYEPAARLLGIPSSTLRWWLDGRGRYAPVLRESSQGTPVTWGEFIEARYLIAYRRDHNVALQRIRAFISSLRESTGAKYPLAIEKPWVGPGRRLLLAAQTDAQLDPEEQAIWEPATGQLLLLTPPAQSFLDVVEFGGVEDERIVRRILPAGKYSPVVIDPDLRGGMASIRGISTSAIKEQVDAGDPIEEVAADFDLDLDLMIAALDYERTLTLAA